MFPGQGSQAKGMGADLFKKYPNMAKVADKILGYSIEHLCCHDNSGKLNQTQYTQPAMYIVSALSYMHALSEGGERPSYFIGHSLGEYNALHASGALSFEDGLRLTVKRGELMSQARNGAMAAILNMSESNITTCLQDAKLNKIELANHNTDSQIVISGNAEEISASQQYIEKSNGIFIPLNTSGAFHSHLMAEAKQAFSQYLAGFTFKPFETPVISNVFARPYQQQSIADCLSDQITHPVKWLQSIEYLLSLGVDEYRELGSGRVLTKLVDNIKKRYLEKGDHIERQNIPDVDNWNNNNNVGTKVHILGIDKEHTTNSKALTLFGFRAVVYVDGFSGYVPLSSVRCA